MLCADDFISMAECEENEYKILLLSVVVLIYHDG